MRLSKVYEQVHEGLVQQMGCQKYIRRFMSLVQQWGCQKYISRFMRVWYSSEVVKSIRAGS